jgi:hypothetical protein
MTTERFTWTRLSGAARSIEAAESPAAALKQLVEASAVLAPRVALYLIRRNQAQGWGSVGYDVDPTRRQQAYRANAGAGWFGRLIATCPAGHEPRPDADREPDFGQEAPAEAAGFVVAVAGKPIAILVAERGAGESPWNPAGIEALVCVVRLRLELSLAARQTAAGGAEAEHPVTSRPEPAAAPRRAHEGPRGVPPAQERQAGAPPRDVAPADARTQASRAGAPAAVQRANAGADPTLEAARRFARLVATDIRLYNEEAVLLGRRNGDLADRLASQLGRGRDTFLRRHSDLGDEGLGLLHDAYVQVLAAGDPALLPARLDRR